MLQTGSRIQKCATSFVVFAVTACAIWVEVGNSPVGAQDTLASPTADAGEQGEFASALRLLPARAAGLIRFPNLPAFCENAGQTSIGRLLEEPAVQDFREAQRELAKGLLDSLDRKIGLKIEDVYEIASGEVVAAWMPYPKEKRRPYAVCVIADIRGRAEKADAVLEQIDKDLIAQKATKSEIKHGGETIRVYAPKTKVGQLKIEQIAIWKSDDRIVASDRDDLVMALIDAVAGKIPDAVIANAPNFKTIRERTEKAILSDADELKTDDHEGIAIGVQWYAEPFAMGQVMKEALEIDRGNDVEILKLLENQGFDAVQAAGGAVAIGVGAYDWMHRGAVLAPPTVEGPQRYKLAARMLDFPNRKRPEIPAWVSPKVATYLHGSWNMSDAFMALETLVDEALGQPIFRDVFEDLKRDDPNGNLDILGRVVPNLGTNVILLTDNVLPATPTSERLLAAIELKDGGVVKASVDEIMSNEDGVVELDDVSGVRIWQYDESSIDDDFGDDLFEDFDDEEEEDETDEQDRLLPRWAVTVIPSDAKGTSYFLFSSHTEFLVETVKRMQKPTGDGFASQSDVKLAMESIARLSPEDVSMTRVARLAMARRVKYELLRKGELKNSDSLMATLVKKLFSEDDLAENDPIRAAKLPPFAQVEKYFGTAGNFIVANADGWSLNGFILRNAE